MVPLLNTAYNNIDTCMISAAPNLTNNVIHYIPDPYQYTVASSGLTLTNIFPSCNSNPGLCASEKI